MKKRPLNAGESGQAAVEAAIVLPLFVFLMLGILQIGLMHQARLMTKYASYRAVRAGAIHNAKVEEMERAALAVMLPLLSEDRSGGEYIQSITSASDFKSKWGTSGVSSNKMSDADMKYVDVVICGPLKGDVGGGQEVDFDDPQEAGQAGWKESQKTKLRVQATFNYRMPIPFANWVIHAAAMNKEVPWVLRMGKKSAGPSKFAHSRYQKYKDAADSGQYILPIRAAYTMRMQSNIYVSQLPEKNECLTSNVPK
ncbi:pilus assembly protein [Stigmatella sp. ncwal1]|uniref:Pilus assembly protein n=1 Tax=Stigmatella ashevillensis TaxID=2995309 RepID=A0ABT5DDQ2_9BACT|nr:TadE family protein [Stigmatella ashevillena]MDC0711810.1 pilus assembly protein [Stigmatella ashevillena]